MDHPHMSDPDLDNLNLDEDSEKDCSQRSTQVSSDILKEKLRTISELVFHCINTMKYYCTDVS